MNSNKDLKKLGIKIGKIENNQDNNDKNKIRPILGNPNNNNDDDKNKINPIFGNPNNNNNDDKNKVRPIFGNPNNNNDDDKNKINPIFGNPNNNNDDDKNKVRPIFGNPNNNDDDKNKVSPIFGNPNNNNNNDDKNKVRPIFGNNEIKPIKSPYYIDFSVYGKNPPIEIQVLKDIRAQNFRIKLDNKNQILSSDLSKYRITIKGAFVDFKFVKYENYSYFIPFDTKDYKSYKIKMYDLENIPIDIDKCSILLSNNKSYNLQNFIINIDLLNKNSTTVYVPEIGKNGKISMKKSTIIPNNKPQSNNKETVFIVPKKSAEELKMEQFTKIESSENLSNTNIKDLIYYLKEKSNNRKLNENDVTDFKNNLEIYDTNYLYENIFLNHTNYSTNAIAILLTIAPFFYTYPRFYNTSFPIIIIGVIGLLMCMNIIQSQYGVLLKNKQLANIFIVTVLLFYLIFFILLNKLNHLTLLFLSAGIVFMIMNYVLRIVISDPKRKFGFKRLQYNENNVTFTLFNPNIDKVCSEIKKRYALNMSSEQLYKYITSFEISEKDEKFVKTEFICNIIQPMLSVLVLFLMGSILSKAKDYKLLKSNMKLLEEELLKKSNPKMSFEQKEYEFLTSPLIGFTDLSNNVINNQYNYYLPKELNLHYIMESIIDEVNDKLIKEKSSHVYEKTLFNEKIIKNLDKHLRRFLRYIESEYLPITIEKKNNVEEEAKENDNKKYMYIKTLRKDNRYNLFDGTYNKIHDVLERYELINFNTSNIEDYFESIIGKNIKTKELKEVIKNSCKDYVFNNSNTLKEDDFKTKLIKNFYEFITKNELGNDVYEKYKVEKDFYTIEMEKISTELSSIENEMNKYNSYLSILPETHVDYQKYKSSYDNSRMKYDNQKSIFNEYKLKYDHIIQIFESISSKYVSKLESSNSTNKLINYIKDLHVDFSDNLFITLIQHIEENNKVVDLDDRNNALNSIKYKFKDIYDFITNEELFSSNEQNILIQIIEHKIKSLFITLYEPKIEYNKNNIILGNVTPDFIKNISNSLFSIIIKPISTWILLGKIMGSAWYCGKMAMNGINKDYTELIRNVEYDGHFSSIWKICSMGVDNVYYQEIISNHRELLVEKEKSMNPMSRGFHYLGAFLFFILFMALLNGYNNMVFGMSMYPLWTNLPALIVLLIILIIIYFVRK